MDRIWTRHWPPGIDEAAIRLPREPLSVILKRAAQRGASKAAIVFYGREVTFAELDDASDRFGGWLVSRGLRPGDRVAIDLENCPQFAIAYFGALKAGAIVVCLNPMHKAIELQHELQDSGARVLVTSDQAYGYWRRPDATAESLQHGGWLFTGDIGRMDDEGYFIIEERKKDMIKASGYSVFPAEVEAIMYRHPAIAEVGVVGVPDPYRGEDVMAFIVLRPRAGEGISEQAIVEWCRGEMAVYKAPRRVRFVDGLPKTASGKILKRALRDAAREPTV